MQPQRHTDCAGAGKRQSFWPQLASAKTPRRGSRSATAAPAGRRPQHWLAGLGGSEDAWSARPPDSTIVLAALFFWGGCGMGCGMGSVGRRRAAAASQQAVMCTIDTPLRPEIQQLRFSPSPLAHKHSHTTHLALLRPLGRTPPAGAAGTQVPPPLPPRGTPLLTLQ